MVPDSQITSLDSLWCWLNLELVWTLSSSFWCIRRYVIENWLIERNVKKSGLFSFFLYSFKRFFCLNGFWTGTFPKVMKRNQKRWNFKSLQLKLERKSLFMYLECIKIPTKGFIYNFVSESQSMLKINVMESGHWTSLRNN